MPAIDHALVTVGFAAQHRERLARVLVPAEITFAARADHWVQGALETADVAILQENAGPEIARAPRMQWVHCDHAGLDGSALRELLASGIAVTSSAGRSAPALAEHALFFMLALAYQYPRFLRAQRLRRWGVPGQSDLRGLHGRTITIVGTGHTGSALVARCRTLDMRVVGYRRSNRPATDAFAEVHSVEAGDRLEDAVTDADFVVLAASLNDGSHLMVGPRQLQAMKPGSYLVNLARGALVDERALVEALRTGHLGGAGLDVASVEPLPPTSPLWRAKNVLITPHVTPRVTDRAARSLDIIEENVRRYRAGEPLLNAVGPEDVFSGATTRQRRSPALTRLWRRITTPLVSR